MTMQNNNRRRRQQGLGMPSAQGMFPTRENPNVRYSYDDQGWKAGLPESAGVNPTPYYSGAYRSIDPSVGDWGLQGPGSDLQQGFSAGEYFDPTITNPYTRDIPMRQPANPTIDYGAQGLGTPMSMEMWPSQGDPEGQYFNTGYNPYYPNQPHTASANPEMDPEYQAALQGLFPNYYEQNFPGRSPLETSRQLRYMDILNASRLSQSPGGVHRRIFDPYSGAAMMQNRREQGRVGSDIQYQPQNPQVGFVPRASGPGFGAASALNQITGRGM